MQRLIMKALTIVLLAFCAGSAHAIPAWPGLLHMLTADGRTVVCRLVGDEHFHAFLTTEGTMMQLDERQLLRPCTAAEAVRKNPRRGAENTDDDGRTSFPTIGDVRGLVLLVEFSDNSFHEEHTQQLFGEMMNGEHYGHGGATGSAATYFRDQSMGLFRPQFDVVGPLKLTRGINFYGQNIGQNDDAYAREMVAEACLQADTLYNIDFTRYDNDGDGIVDFVYVFYAGYGESYGAPSYTIWPHQGALQDFGVSCQIDGVGVNRYACSSELKYTSGNTLEGIGTFCHEFGHVLGLPDLYMTNGGNNHFLGSWDIMDVGCYNNSSHTPPSYSAFERYCMRWLEYTDISRQMAGIQLPDIATDNKAYRLSGPNTDEYFVIENRQPQGWDAHIGGHGMLITHIDFEPSFWRNNSVNNNTGHPCVTIVAADGTPGITPEGDAFPGVTGKTSFTDYTTPSSTLWDGTPLGKSVSGITEHADGMVTFSLMQDKLDTPEMLPPTNVTDTSFIAHWTPVANAVSYTLTLRPLLADTLLPVPVAEEFSLMSEGDITGRNNPRIDDRLDSLMQQPGWSGQELYDAGGYIQIGRYGVSGHLSTPNVSLASDDSAMTIVATLRAYSGRSVNYDIVVTDADNSALIDSLRGKAQAYPDTLIRHIDIPDGVRAIKVALTSVRERLFTDRLLVVRGNIPDEDAIQATNPQLQWQGIVGESMEIGNLTPGTTYEMTVQALVGDPLYDSDVSKPLVVTLPAPGQTGIMSLNSEAAPVSIYNSQGMLVYKGAAEHLPHTLMHGMHIIRQGRNTKKVVF